MAHIPDSDSFLSGDEWFMFKFGEWTHHSSGNSEQGPGAGELEQGRDLEEGIWSGMR